MTLVRLTEYGHSSGRPLVYFHGVPGSPLEAAVFDSSAKHYGLRVLCFDRFLIDRSITGPAYYQYIANAIDRKLDGTPLDIAGFSIGSHVALETCQYLSSQVRSLHLISAVAPLDKGEFLQGMAGKTVFSLATRHPMLFRLLAHWQRLLADRLPGRLFDLLFASAQGQDRTLARQPEFRAFMSDVLTASFAHGVEGYVRDVQQFLAPWSNMALTCKTPTRLWHGEADNWSPLGMSEFLAASLVSAGAIERGPELSHYSCLYDAAPKVCRELSR